MKFINSSTDHNNHSAGHRIETIRQKIRINFHLFTQNTNRLA